ncbi:MAG: hypothetical protein R3C59_01315 [Planctomycetaceae bacterium]
MSDELAGDAIGNGVSPQRKKISAVILIVLLAVLAIELRAGLGHSMSGKALQAAAPEGVFESGKVTHADVQGMLKLWPSETVLKQTDDEIEYQYSWFSLLRPLLSRPPTNVYVAVLNNQSATALRYGTEGPSAEELEAARNPPPPNTDGAPDMGGMMGGGPGGGGEGRGPRSGGQEGGGKRQRPALDDGDSPDAATSDEKPADEKPADEKPADEAAPKSEVQPDEPKADETQN